MSSTGDANSADSKQPTGLAPDDAVLAAVLESVDCGLLVFGEGGELRSLSERFAAIFSLKQAELRTLRNLEDLAACLSPHFADPTRTLACWRERAKIAACNEAFCDDVELAQPEPKLLERSIRPVLDPRGNQIGRVEVYRDITRSRLAEKRLLHNDRLLALGQLVSSIAHEVNNPLTSILGYAQLLCSRLGNSGVGREAHYILEQAERASRTAKNLLLYAREGKPKRVAVDLNEIAEHTIALRSSDLRLRNILIDADLDPHAPLALGDPTQMQQVLLNLVLNAEQSLQQRGGPGRIVLRTRRVSGWAALEVSDDGSGIAAEVLPRIFDPFFTTKPPGIGTGLGLSIVYGIVRDHGGDVSVESDAEHGASFKVRLPVAKGVVPHITEHGVEGVLPPASRRRLGSTRAAANRPDNKLAAKTTAEKPVTDRRDTARILVVEDEPTVAHLIADVLRADGHTVEVALDSREGFARASGTPYDVIVCDLRMPHFDGRNFYQELLRRSHSLAKRLVFVTGDVLASSTAEFLETSGVPYLAKPFLAEELKATVYGALARARRSSCEDRGAHSTKAHSPSGKS